MFKPMHEILQEGKIGNYKLEKFTINAKNKPFRCDISEGNYIQLKSFNGCIMSNTPMEKNTNYEFVYNAFGDVFIVGLGIGLILLPIQEKDSINSIIVLEKYKEIIELVGQQLPLNHKVKIIQGDVFEYQFPKGTKFDCLYFDIWDYINSDVYEEMKALKKKYLKYKKSKSESPNGFIKCWAEYEAKHNMSL